MNKKANIKLSNKKYPYIEINEFERYSELKVVVKRKRPDFRYGSKIVSKGRYYTEYLSRYVDRTAGFSGHERITYTPYVWVVHKPNFIERWLGISYDDKINKEINKIKYKVKE